MTDAVETIAHELTLVREILEKIHMELQWAVNNDRLRSDPEQIAQIHDKLAALADSLPKKQAELF